LSDALSRPSEARSYRRAAGIGDPISIGDGSGSADADGPNDVYVHGDVGGVDDDAYNRDRGSLSCRS
jgi:hypothetical protein